MPTVNLPDLILAADWAKVPKGRSVYVADVEAATVGPHGETAWSLETILDAARQYREDRRRVLVSMDLAFGVPAGYWRDVKQIPRWTGACHFVDWLELIGQENVIWQEVRQPLEWRVEQPFFAIPPRPGGRSDYDRKAGYSMLRAIDRSSQAKPIFCVSGIPGTVGSGTRSLWRELAPLLQGPRDFRIWPFEGCLETLLDECQIVLAEGYPGIAYTAALESNLPAPMRRIGKTKASQRANAVDQLTNAAWITHHEVTLDGLSGALESEDDFDALMSAAGLLRCVLAGYPIEGPDIDPVAEGGILLSPVIDFSSRKKTARSTRIAKPRP